MPLNYIADKLSKIRISEARGRRYASSSLCSSSCSTRVWEMCPSTRSWVRSTREQKDRACLRALNPQCGGRWKPLSKFTLTAWPLLSTDWIIYKGENLPAWTSANVSKPSWQVTALWNAFFYSVWMTSHAPWKPDNLSSTQLTTRTTSATSLKTLFRLRKSSWT